MGSVRFVGVLSAKSESNVEQGTLTGKLRYIDPLERKRKERCCGGSERWCLNLKVVQNSDIVI